MGSTDSKFIGIILGNVDGITHRLEIGTYLSSLDGSFDGYNYGKLEGLFFGCSLGSTYGKVLVYDE